VYPILCQYKITSAKVNKKIKQISSTEISSHPNNNTSDFDFSDLDHEAPSTTVQVDADPLPDHNSLKWEFTKASSHKQSLPSTESIESPFNKTLNTSIHKVNKSNLNYIDAACIKKSDSKNINKFTSQALSCR
jgi:hypothetical protein